MWLRVFGNQSDFGFIFCFLLNESYTGCATDISLYVDLMCRCAVITTFTSEISCLKAHGWCLAVLVGFVCGVYRITVYDVWLLKVFN